MNLEDKNNSVELRKMLYEIIKNYVDNYWWLEDSLRLKESSRFYKTAKGNHYFTARYIPGVSQILESMHHMGLQNAMIEFHKFDSNNLITLLNNLWGLPMNLHPSKEEWIECWEWFLEIVQKEVVKQCCKLDEETHPESRIEQIEQKKEKPITEEEESVKLEKLKMLQEKNSSLEKMQKAFDLTIYRERT